MLHQLAQALGVEITRGELLNGFVRLLKDTEAEVRTAAASKVTGFCSLVSVDTIIKLILPCVRELASDQSQHVRGML